MKIQCWYHRVLSSVKWGVLIELKGTSKSSIRSAMGGERNRKSLVLGAIAIAFMLDAAVRPFVGKPLLLDFLVLLIASSQVKWSFHAVRRILQRLDRWRMLQLLLGLSALFFLILWEARWFGHLGPESIRDVSLRYRTFLHAGLFLSLALLAMESRHLLKWWSVVELTPVRLAFITYAVTLAAGTLLLILPWSLNPDASIRLIDALFVAVSALSVTGLSTVPFVDTFSIPGQATVLLLIQLGGLGIVTLGVGLAALTRSRLSLSQALVGQELYDVPTVGQISPFLLKVLATTVVAEMLGAIWIYTALPSGYPNRAFHAMFHSVSAFCNAGFSTFPGNLDMPGLMSFKWAIALLVIGGGFGFPVLFEAIAVLAKRLGLRKGMGRSLSAHATLTCWVAIVLWASGALGILGAETFSPRRSMEFLDRLGQALFYSVSARTAGFNLMPVQALSSGSQLVLIFLMVIGGAPISTAGGIKTTTAGVMGVAAFNVLRGHKWIQFKRREISPLVLQKALAVAFLYSAAVFVTTLILIAVEPLDPWALAFEAVSAASTVGLSLGITEQLGSISKLLLMLLMVSGRLGLMVIVYVGVGTIATQRFRYPVERFYVG